MARDHLSAPAMPDSNPETGLPARDLYKELFNHLTLPARLPSMQHPDLSLVEDFLFQNLVEATQHLNSSDATTNYYSFGCVAASIRASQMLTVNGRFDKSAFNKALIDLTESQNSFLFLHIASQNAGVLMQKTTQ